MRDFFDSSSLLAAMVEDEPGHESALAALAASRDGHASTHSLAECFATLTGGRMAVRLAPFEAAELVDVNVRQRLTLVSLTPAEHAAALRTAASVGARGGAVYDVLLLAAARKCQADRIHTLNHRHFVAFAPDLVSCLGNRWRFVAPRRPLGKAGGRSLFVPRRKDDGRTTKRRGFLGATRRAAGLFASHVVARSLQTTSGLLVARALWDTKTPRGETPAISETRHEVIGWFRAMRVDGVGRTGLPGPFHPFREEIPPKTPVLP